MQQQLQDWGFETVLMTTVGSELHQPVLLRETMALLAPELGGLYVDCTVGAGGHAEAILQASVETFVVGIDRDRDAVETATERLGRFNGRFQIVQADFKQLREILDQLGIDQVDGVLADLGVSSMQLERAERGFSFQQEGPLDMRMDRRQQLTAADLVNTLSEEELADLIYHFGEERLARRIARAIVREREKHMIETTTQLADVIVRAYRRSKWGHIHPATRTFQALRIAVNDELKELNTFVDSAIDVLKVGGRLVVIAFHSLEDRILKQAFKLNAGQCQCLSRPAILEAESPVTGCPRCGAKRRVELLTRKPVRPSEAEVTMNPRARSARLRACRKLGEDNHKFRR
jgi:16S rRNA (cytosine1402-N4)-methyltransferase